MNKVSLLTMIILIICKVKCLLTSTSNVDDSPVIVKLIVNATTQPTIVATLTKLPNGVSLKAPFYVVSIFPEEPEQFKRLLDVDLDTGDIKLLAQPTSIVKFSALSINDGNAVIVVLSVPSPTTTTTPTTTKTTTTTTRKTSASSTKSLIMMTTSHKQICLSLSSVASPQKLDDYLSDVNEFVESTKPVDRLIETCVHLRDERQQFETKSIECENKRNLNELFAIITKTQRETFYDDWIGFILFYCNQFDRHTPSFVYLNRKSIDDYLNSHSILNKNLNNPDSLLKNQMEKFNLFFSQAKQSMLNVSLKCQRNQFDYRFNFNLRIENTKRLDFVYFDLNSVEHLNPLPSLSFIRLLERFNKQTTAGILITSISASKTVQQNDCDTTNLSSSRSTFGPTNVSSKFDLIDLKSTRIVYKIDLTTTTKISQSKTNSIASIHSKSFETIKSSDVDSDPMNTKNKFLTLNRIIFVIVIGLIIVILVIILILTFFIHKRTSFDSLSKYANTKRINANANKKRRNSRLINESTINLNNQSSNRWKFNPIRMLLSLLTTRDESSSNARRSLSYNNSTCSANLTAHMRRVNSDKSRSNQLNNNLIYSPNDNPNTHYLRPIMNLFASMFNSTSNTSESSIEPTQTVITPLDITKLPMRSSLELCNGNNTMSTVKTRISTTENADNQAIIESTSREFALSQSYLNNIGVSFVRPLSLNEQTNQAATNSKELFDQTASFWLDKLPSMSVDDNNTASNYLSFNRNFKRTNGVDSLKSIDARSEYMEICFNTWYNLLDWVPEYTSLSHVLEDLALLSDNKKNAQQE